MVLDRKSMIELDNPEGIKIAETLKGMIELDDVYFYYTSRPGQMIFQGPSLSIEVGKMMALVWKDWLWQIYYHRIDREILRSSITNGPN